MKVLSVGLAVIETELEKINLAIQTDSRIAESEEIKKAKEMLKMRSIL